MKITEPGIFYDFPVDDYFADPTPEPSLSQSIVKVLIERSPAHAWMRHPRLNPKFKADDPTKYDVGNIAHTLLLGRGKRLKVLPHADWRKDAAKADRAAAAEAGLLAVLEKDHALGKAMADAAMAQIEERGYGASFLAADSEVVIAAKDGPVWLKAMIDRLTKTRQRVFDYKTTSASASPWALDWRMVDGGWPLQSAMHEKILDIVDADNAGRREHLFIVQEDEEPYALSIVRLPESALVIGRKQLAAGIDMWTECRASGVWPAYPIDTVIASYPGSAETKWLNREIAEADQKPRRGGMLPSMMAG